MEMETQLLNHLPVLHVKGTNFTIGYIMGRTFKNLVHNHWNKAVFTQQLASVYETEEGKTIYNNCLELCKKKYPLYVEELEGISQGSEMAFFKLFLLHIDTLLIPPDQSLIFHETKKSGENGCSDIMAFDKTKNILLLGHTEDCSKEMQNNMFIIIAKVLDKDEQTELEYFAAIAYAGYLPGFTMGFNRHGLYCSGNTMVPAQTFPERTPVLFLNRAILGANNLEQALKIIKDDTADGFNINFIYAPNNSMENAMVQSIEVAPAQHGESESAFDVQIVKNGESYAHCNKYLRMKIPQMTGRMASSENRLKAIQELTGNNNNKPYDLNIAIQILSDRSNPEYPLYRNGKGKDLGITGAVGIFDIPNKKWCIYKEPPINAEPIAIISLDL